MFKASINNLKNNPFVLMLSHFKNYFVAELAMKAMAFISIPVLTRLLTPADYGIISVFNTYAGIFVILFTLNVFSSVSRYYYEDKEDFNDLFSTSVTFTLIILAITLPIFIYFRSSFGLLLNLPIIAIILLIPVVLSKISFSFFSQVYVPQKKSKIIAYFNVSRVYIEFSLAIVIILLLKNELYLGPILASSIIGIIYTIYCIYSLKKYFKISLKKDHLSYILKYSLPLLPYALGGIILAQFDRIMINNISGSSKTGLYSFAYNIGYLQYIFASAIFQAWMPDYFKYMNSKKYREIQSDIIRIFKIISSFCLFLVLFGSDIGQILGAKNFHSALDIVPIVVVGYLFMSVFSIYAQPIGYAKKTFYSSIILLSSGTLNIVLNAIYLPVYGYKAGAVTTLISYLFMGLFSWFICKVFIKEFSVSLKIIIPALFTVISAITTFYLVTYSFHITGFSLYFFKILVLTVLFLTFFHKQIFKILQQ